MRVYSVSGSISPVKSNSKPQSVKSISNPNNSFSNGVVLAFTGKNLDQFLSYAPENKRYNVKAYNQGGLGVVAQEAPISWRLRENADVRDFSPYHSYGNLDGGVRVVKLQKKDGVYLDTYPQTSFIHANADETLEQVRKRLNIDPKQELSFAIQLAPDQKGNSGIIRLVDAGIKGSFIRPSELSISEEQEVGYRLFRATNIEDSVDLAMNNLKNKAIAKAQKPLKDEIRIAVEKEFEDKLNEARELDENLSKKAFEEYSKNKDQEVPFKPITENTQKVRSEINEEIKKHLASKDIKKQLKQIKEEALKSEDLQKSIVEIEKGSAPKVNERNASYFIHTSDLSAFENAYGAGEGGGYGTYGTYSTYSTYGTYGTKGGAGISTNVMYADNNRALVEIIPQLNTPEHGNYNPGNWWLHDRPAFMVMNAVADKSYFGDKYYNGLKIHGTFHNPGRDYQGAESNPFEFFKMVAHPQDIEKLNEHPQIETLKEIEGRWDTASAEEKRFVNQILRPFMENFLDDFVDEANDLKTFNISMTPVAATKLNPQNMSAGTVSRNYGKEMKSSQTPDIAQFMTKKLAEINTIDITNGSTPANLRLNDPNADFGADNGLTRNKNGFTPYEYKPVIKDGKLVSDNINEILEAKKSNLKWLLNSLGNAFDKAGQNAVSKMFFNDKQISEGASILGHLSNYKEGDMLFFSWGRPDPQKGYPSILQAFKDFLQDSNVPQEVKKHTKVLTGAGVWDRNARDFKLIEKIIKEIEELDGGIYKGNVCHVNGRISNRLVACATHSIFTSRFEPCGITPLESFASGTPVISTNTGGAPDFISATRGYLTKHAYLRSLEDLGINEAELAGKSNIAEIIDDARLIANASEVRECMLAAITDFNQEPQKYIEMMQDAIQQKIDWHENSAYNGGKSANELYMTEVFERNKGEASRNTERLNRLVGERFGFADALQESINKVRSKWSKAIIFTGLGIAALGSAAYVYLRQQAKPEEKNTELNKIA